MSKLQTTPSGWKLTTLGTFMEFKNGVNADKNAYGSGTEFVNVMDIFKRNFMKKCNILGKVEITEKQKVEYSVKYGDILFNRTSEVPDEIAFSSVYLDEAEITFGGFVIRGRQKKELLDPLFAGYCFNNSSIRREMIRRSQGVVRANIGQKDLNKVPILIPPKDEQKKIASVLALWDDAIAKTEALIAVKEKQFEWLCTNLLSGRKKSFGFTGKSIPTAFGSIFSLFKKVNTSCADYEVLSVTKDGIVSQSEYFNKEVASKDKSKYLIVDKDTLVMSGLNFWMGAIDFQTIRDTGIVSPAYKTFKVNEGPYNRDYLRFFIRSHYMTKILLDSSIQGASIVRRNLDMEWLSNSLIDLPNLEEQIDIANILSSAEKEIDGLKLLAEKYHSQKRGLMQKLLTGEWQVGSSQLLSEETCQELSREGVA